MPGAFEGKVVVAARSQDKFVEVAREIGALGAKALVIETDVELREELARMVDLTPGIP